MSGIKVKSVGSNPKIFDNGVILGAMWLKYYYLTTLGWSKAYDTEEEAFEVAAAIEDARKKADAAKKKK